MRTVFWVAFWTFLTDQATKYYAVHFLDLATRGRIEVMPPYFNLSMAWNYGINFGLMAQDSPLVRWVFVAVALVIMAAVVWWVHHDPAGRWQRFAAGLLIGGALGNVIDRLIYGAVADFINMSCCGFDNPYSFNVADVAVFVGAFGMIVFTSDKKAS